MKPFDIELVKQGKPVVTRRGNPARVICTDVKREHSVIALIMNENNRETALTYPPSGRYTGPKCDSDYDLFMVPEKKSGWVNIYSSGACGGRIFTTKEEAVSFAIDRGVYATLIDTVLVEWEG